MKIALFFWTLSGVVKLSPSRGFMCSAEGGSAQPLVAKATGLNEKEISIKIKAEFKDVI